MTRSLMMQVVLALGAITAIGLFLFFAYRSWKLVSADLALREEMEAAGEHLERTLRMQRWLMPYLRPVGWKRVPLNKPINLPHIQNRTIKIHLNAPLTIRKPKRKWWTRSR
jgi:hypothetical protein